MSRLTIVPSPTPEVILKPYSDAEFPQFSQIFKPVDENSSPSLKMMHRPAEEAEMTLVLHNRSPKAITALQSHWLIKHKMGGVMPWTNSPDGYGDQVVHPIVTPGDRHLVSLTVNVSEKTVADVLSRRQELVAFASGYDYILTAEVTFQIYLVLFEDGEIAGPDPEHFCDQLIRRKQAAEFVARQIRLAESEKRDVRPVLSALREAPYLESDYAAEWIQWYAKSYLIGAESKRKQIDRLEHLAVLPKFYRRVANSAE